MAEEADVRLPPNEDRGPMLLGVTWMMVAMASMTVVLRVYCRTVLQNTMGWDDFAILAAVFSTIVGNALITLQVHAGYGRHVYYLSKHQVIETTKWTTLSEVQSAIGVYFVKLSVCLFILRMIAGTHKVMRRILLSIITILTLLMLGNVLVICLQCIPFEAVWNPAISARCIPASSLLKASKSFNAFGVATDFICVMLPTLVLRGLQMSTNTKIGLMIVMGLGTLTAACSLGKTISIQFKSEDITWNLIGVEIWACFEENLGIIIASLPACRRFFASELDRIHIRSYLNRLTLSTKQNSFVRSRNNTSSQQESGADKLVPLQDIQVTNSLEIQSTARTPSDSELGRGSDTPDQWRSLETVGQTAVESV